MHTTDVLRRHLHTLSDALDVPGDDLHAMLEVLTDDLTAAVPSLLGLRITMTVDEVTITLNMLDPFQAPAVRTSLRIPLQGGQRRRAI